MSPGLALNDLINTPHMRTHLGASPGHSYIRKFGYNPDVDGAEDLWDQGGTYTFLASAATLYASSSHRRGSVRRSTTDSLQDQGQDDAW
jgi:hypothetical protein